MGISSKDKRDLYYYKAKAMGYRARSAFKLLDIDKTFRVFDGAQRIVDLCAAPGSWSQVLDGLPGTTVVAIDVQEIAPIGNVIRIKEDITSASCLQKTKDAFRGEKVDLVVCDGAPDVTGFHDLDEFLQADLLKSALSISLAIGRLGSTFIGKCFRGELTGHIVAHFRKFYGTVRVVKPKASRGASVECFLLCTDMLATAADPLVIRIEGSPEPFQIEACGDGEDPDFTFEGAMYSQPASFQPIAPPYSDAIDLRRASITKK